MKVWGTENRLVVGAKGADPEYFAVNNTVPYVTEKIPLVNIHDPSYNFNRAKHTFYI